VPFSYERRTLAHLLSPLELLMPAKPAPSILNTVEGQRLTDVDAERWREWGPYLSERQWGTVREDYSADGDAWN
jgi:hypothetical protein